MDWVHLFTRHHPLRVLRHLRFLRVKTDPSRFPLLPVTSASSKEAHRDPFVNGSLRPSVPPTNPNGTNAVTSPDPAVAVSESATST